MIDKLKQELTEAAQAYYHDGTILMTDEEYDSKLEYLESIMTEEDYDEIKELFESPSAGTINKGKGLLEHDHPMLSLAKAKNEDELKKYYDRMVEAGAKGFTLQEKLDGLAMSATYQNGKIDKMVTRGDGVHGESMLYLSTQSELTIKHFPLNINDNRKVEVRGEVFASNSQFNVFNKARLIAQGEEFSNSRNAVAGMVKKAEGGLGYNAEISFIAYSGYIDNKSASQDELKALGFMTAEELTKSEVQANYEHYDKVLSVGNDFADLMFAVNEFGKLRDKIDSPTDGVVIKPTNEIEMLDKMGLTSHHPIAFIAYKYPGVKAITKVVEITVTVGKTGALTPQARVEPVEVDGSILTNFTCHNYNWLYDMGIREGATVYVTKANDVIPAIHSVVDSGPNSLPAVPTACPSCGTTLLNGDSLTPSKTIYCPNETCASRMKYYIKSILGRTYLHIDGIGDVLLESIVDTGKLNSIVDLFKLDVDDMKDLVIGYSDNGNPRKLGEGRAKNIRTSIESAKENTPDYRLLASLGIEGVSANSSKQLIEHFGSIENVLTATYSDLQTVPNFGEVRIANIVSKQEETLSTLRELISMGVKVNAQKPKQVATKGSFSVSGSVEGFSNRASFIEHMENEGWEYHKSPKKDTDILFADPQGTSSKIKKAIANGTKIMDSIENL